MNYLSGGHHNHSSSDTDSDSDDDETPNWIEELERKSSHPYSLHRDLWFNDPGEVSGTFLQPGSKWTSKGELKILRGPQISGGELGVNGIWWRS